MCSSVVFELVEEKKDRKNQKFLQPPSSTKTHAYFIFDNSRHRVKSQPFSNS